MTEPGDRHAPVSVIAMGEIRIRCASEWPSEVSLENMLVPSADRVAIPGGNSAVPHPMAQEGGALGGVVVDGTLEEDDPGTWETHPLG